MRRKQVRDGAKRYGELDRGSVRVAVPQLKGSFKLSNGASVNRGAQPATYDTTIRPVLDDWIYRTHCPQSPQGAPGKAEQSIPSYFCALTRMGHLQARALQLIAWQQCPILHFFSDANVTLQSLDDGIHDGRGVNGVGVGYRECIGLSQRVGHPV